MDIYLDTESTGLGDNDEVIEIAVVSDSGDVLLDSLVQCQSTISSEASNIHGIQNSDLIHAPTWGDLSVQLFPILTKASRVFIYNANFDIRLLKQSLSRHQLSLPAFNAMCLMKLYARVFNHGQYCKLIDACNFLSVNVADLNAHRAADDCQMLYRLHSEIKRVQDNKLKKQRSRDVLNKKKRAFIPANEQDYPYFGQRNRPVGYVTLSSISLRDMERYQFAGTCCDAFGNKGYLFKLIVE